MTTKQPPRLAAWLLERFGMSEANDAIAGDLLEEYQHRGSSGWYWRQVAGSLLAGAFQDLRSHKWLTFRAIVVGLIALEVTAYFVANVSSAWVTLGFDAVQWGKNPAGTAAYFCIIATSGTVSGWIVTRGYPAHWKSLLLGYLVALMAVIAIQLTLTPLVAGQWELYRSMLPLQLALGFVGLPGSILIGGLLGAPSEPANCS